MVAGHGALYEGGRSYEELLGGLSLDGCPPRYGVPVILTAGERDWTTPYPLAAAYYDTLSAPCKVFLSLPDAGHLPFQERPEEWSHILLDANLTGPRPLGDRGPAVSGSGRPAWR